MGFLDGFMGGQPKDPNNYVEPIDVNDFLQSMGVGSNQNRPTTAVNSIQSGGASNNKFRPAKLKDFIGQDASKEMLRNFIDSVKGSGKKFPHTLLASGPGKGKTTLASIIGNELGRDVYWEKAPISLERLLRLMSVLKDNDIIVLDEVHLQAKGKLSANGLETLYKVMEDGVIETEQGIFKYPDITIIGCTTDSGLLHSAFLDRFIIRPPINDYTVDDMKLIAELNAEQLEYGITEEAKEIFAKACMWTPRIMNSFVTQGSLMCDLLVKMTIDEDVANLVLTNQAIEPDGLTHDHMKYLEILFRSLRKVNSQKEWIAGASLGTITKGMGINDTKFVMDRIEPLLFKLGFVEIHNKRVLTDKGFERLGQQRPVWSK